MIAKVMYNNSEMVKSHMNSTLPRVIKLQDDKTQKRVSV